jgi:hypothetical protein
MNLQIIGLKLKNYPVPLILKDALRKISLKLIYLQKDNCMGYHVAGFDCDFIIGETEEGIFRNGGHYAMNNTWNKNGKFTSQFRQKLRHVITDRQLC